jgi:tetratricopeptide (TPR) repeat protein
MRARFFRVRAAMLAWVLAAPASLIAQKARVGRAIGFGEDGRFAEAAALFEATLAEDSVAGTTRSEDGLRVSRDALAGQVPVEMAKVFFAGMHQWANGNTDEALTAFLIASKGAPSQPILAFYAGQFLLDKDRLREARQAFTRAVTLDSTFALAWVRLGDVDAILMRPHAWRREFERAIALRPGLAASYNSRGLAMGMVGEFAAALPDIRRATELAPRNPWFGFQLVSLYFETCDFEAAIRQAEAVRSLGVDLKEIPAYLRPDALRQFAAGARDPDRRPRQCPPSYKPADGSQNGKEVHFGSCSGFGCSWRERVKNERELIRLQCDEPLVTRAVARDDTTFAILEDARVSRGGYAGTLDNSGPLFYDVWSWPLGAVSGGLTRVATAQGLHLVEDSTGGHAVLALRLARFHTYGVSGMRSNSAVADAWLSLALLRPAGDTLWSASVSASDTVRASNMHVIHHERALNGALCRTIAALADSLATDRFGKALHGAALGAPVARNR